MKIENMNRAQRLHVGQAIIALLVLVALAVTEPWYRSNPLLRVLITVSLSATAIIMSRRNARVSSGVKTIEVIRAHPAVKAWLVGCTLILATVATLIGFGVLSKPTDVSYAVLILIFSVFFGPLFFVIFWKQYEELSNSPGMTDHVEH